MRYTEWIEFIEELEPKAEAATKPGDAKRNGQKMKENSWLDSDGGSDLEM